MISSKARGVITPSLRRVRYSPAVAAHYSAVFNAALTHTEPNRPFSTTPHRQTPRSGQHSARRVINQRQRVKPATQTRAKCSWTPGRLTTALGRWRLHSSWHRPGCKWVRSEGDPRSTPRDKDCSACQAEERATHQMSRRELMWERHLDDVKKFIERDPYEFLFGRSNDRLRALWGDNWKWPGSRWDETHPLWPGWSSTRDAKTRKEKAGEDNAAATEIKVEVKTSTDHGKAVSAEENLDKTNSTGKLSAEGPKVFVQSSGSWSVSGFQNGKSFQASGELEYDPITMRMVPKTTKPAIEPAASEPVKESPKVPVAVPKQPSAESGDATPIPIKQSSPAEQSDINQSVPSSGELSNKRKRDSTAQRMLTAIEKRRSLTPSTVSTTSSACITKPTTSTAVDLRQNTLAKRLARLKLEMRHVESLASGTPDLPAAKVVNGEAQPMSSVTKQQLVKEVNSARIEAKRALERGWVKENQSRHGTTPVVPSVASVDAQKSVAASPHYAQSTVTPSTSTETPSATTERNRAEAIQRLSSRRFPLKMMSANDVGVHRAALLRIFEDKQKARALASDAEKQSAEKAEAKQLRDEVEAQKRAMTGFEDKWHRRVPPGQSSGEAKSTLAPAKTEPATGNSAAGDKGVLTPKTVDYINRRWFEEHDSRREKALPPRTITPRITIGNSNSAALRTEAERLHDRKLVRSIRDIYETAYGKIEPTHRQPSKVFSTNESLAKEEAEATANSSATLSNSQEAVKNELATSLQRDIQANTALLSKNDEIASVKEPAEPGTQASDLPNPSSDPNLYQVLAYDPSTERIYSASASSSFTPPTGEKVLAFADALVRLQAPAKFLPWLAKIQAQGYDVVSANKHLLVLKRVRPADDNAAPVTAGVESAPVASRSSVNPVDGTGRQQEVPQTTTGNFASPTGFVNYDLPASTLSLPTTKAPAPSRTPSANNPRIKREEYVFTGTSKGSTVPPPPPPPQGSSVSTSPNDGAGSASGPTASSSAGSGGNNDQPPSSASTIGTASEQPPNYNNPRGERAQHFRHHQRRSRGRFRRFRRMLFVGVWVAACCYATGAWIESRRPGPPPSSSSGGGGGSSNYIAESPLAESAATAEEATVASQEPVSKKDRRRRRREARQASAAAAAAQEEELAQQKRRQPSMAWQVTALAAELAVVALAGMLLRAVGLWLLA